MNKKLVLIDKITRITKQNQLIQLMKQFLELGYHVDVESKVYEHIASNSISQKTKSICYNLSIYKVEE